MFRCATLRLEPYADAVFFSEFTDSLANLHERPEVMQLLVANFAVVRVVSDMLQVAYDEVCDMLGI
jgi:hypothetical protein